ncbi:hypothetical protein F5Y16DRAFT_421984 [Xylariaceae sp. FL0255]|nr:hypothetical protein F5Y16DRAFT_421984 [Xylariaceae sp. FL0255]
MSPATKTFARSATDEPRSRRVYDEDQDDERERLRGRLSSRTRTTPRGKPRPSTRTRTRTPSTSASDDSDNSDSDDIPTPTRSSYPRRSAPPTAPSPDSSSSSGEDSLTEDHKRKPRTLKQRMNGTSDAPTKSPGRSSRKSRRSAAAIEVESESGSDNSESDTMPQRGHVIVKKSLVSTPRRKQRHSEGHLSSSSRRYVKIHQAPQEILPFRRPSCCVWFAHQSIPQPGFFVQARAWKHILRLIIPTRRRVSCVSCTDDLPSKKLAKLKCGHRWCKDCLKRKFKLSIDDLQHMPPKCCTPDGIPLKHVNDLFDNTFKRAWNKKYAEISTQDRIYCPKKKCGKFISPDTIHQHRNGRESARCSCGTRVCCDCNNKWHESKRCPVDEDEAQLLRHAKEEGWQRCYKCRTMVELKEGCNHMTCRCGAQFCMICGSKWKSCECSLFNYDMMDDDFDHTGVPMLDRRHRGGLPQGHPYTPRTRRRYGSYDELPRRLQEQRDEQYARRLERDSYDNDDDDDDFLAGMGDVIGIGNASGHFMNSDYRRMSQSTIITPPGPPLPPSPPSATFERAALPTNHYVSGIKKARGVRGGSMERRLADRFSDQRQTGSSQYRPFPNHPLPPSLPPEPRALPRRHTMEDELGNTFDYVDEFTSSPISGRSRRYHDVYTPTGSELAGLTGPSSGMDRVSEWRHYIPEGATAR